MARRSGWFMDSHRHHVTEQVRQAPRRLIVNRFLHAVLLRRGIVERVLEPGVHRLRPRTDQVALFSAVPQSIIVPSQEMLTADGVTVRATVALVLTVTDPTAALAAGSRRERLYLSVQLALRASITAMTLEQVMAARVDLDGPILETATAQAADLGVTVDALGVRDLVIPGEQRKLMAQVVEARLAGQASLERARGETAALRNLSNAAALLKDNPELYKLRLLQEMGSSSGHTFVVGDAAKV